MKLKLTGKSQETLQKRFEQSYRQVLSFIYNYYEISPETTVYCDEFNVPLLVQEFVNENILQILFYGTGECYQIENGKLRLC